MILTFLGGDGDPSYLSEGFEAEVVTEPWFRGLVNDEPAILVQMLTGPHRGDYVALTSRYNTSLQDQLERQKFVGVVMHPVGPSPQDELGLQILPPVGMAALQIKA